MVKRNLRDENGQLRMTNSAAKKVVFISTFPPRKCGIATFTSDLSKSTKAAANGEFEPLVVAMSSGNQKYEDPVKFEIRQNVKSDYVCAADYINFSHVDIVSVQHEFGLFGGRAGSYLSLLLNRLKAPVITTLHTVIDDPNPDFHRSMVDVCSASANVVTMNERGVGMLRDIYGVPTDKVKLIPHGIPDLPFVDSNYYKHKFGLEDRKTILTFGLLSKNKGIEVMLRAMPEVIKTDPSVIYIILGMTHPNILKHEGESYRFSLQQMVKDLNLHDHVVFHNRFVDDQELHNFLCAADIYVTPYLNEKQLTSGTLSFAVGVGKAVVSTPYWAATELLADGRGKLVNFGDSDETAQAIIEILRNDSMFYSLRRQAYEYGRARTWPNIGHKYWELFNSKRSPSAIVMRAKLSAAETNMDPADRTSTNGQASATREEQCPMTMLLSIELPEPSLDHLAKLTDDTGIYQHAKYAIPNREFGYCTDDNARALIAMVEYYNQYHEPQAVKLLDTYLSFTMYSQKEDGTVRNFMDFDRKWVENEPAHDAFGRLLWAFGTVMAKSPTPEYLSIAKDCFDKSIEHVQKQLPRGMAYSIFGMSDYLKQFPGASDIKRQLELAADGLVTQYRENAYSDWQWFEDILTYDNAVLPQALFVAGQTSGNEKYTAVALESCEFLLTNTLIGDHFSFIGCNGWYERGGKRATFDQQPLEAAGTVRMLGSAYDATGDMRFLKLQRKAFDWFLGANDLNTPLYDFRTKGCNDGLMDDGVNANQGAESTLSYFLSLLSMLQSYARIEKSAEQKPGQFLQIDLDEPPTPKNRQDSFMPAESRFR